MLPFFFCSSPIKINVCFSLSDDQIINDNKTRDNFNCEFKAMKTDCSRALHISVIENKKYG